MKKINVEQKVSEKRGITLIALVITIIVMLILVGVTINMALNGGLFGYAKKAKENTTEALDYENSLAEGIINGQTIDDIVGTATSDDWYGKPAQELKTDKDGNYHISTCAELALFAKKVNEGNDFAGKTVYLDKNLDLQGNKDKQWTPIGLDSNKPFNGTFDGKNHYVAGMYIDTDEENYCYGLFGNVEFGNIENIGAINGHIKSSSSCGGIVGIFSNQSGYIKKCYNSCEVVSNNTVGGIAGFAYGTIEKCYNTGKITGEEANGTGGIVGDAAYGTIKECYNVGEITSVEGYVGVTGGIVGWEEEESLTIVDCYNRGKVKGKLSGGIIGFLHYSSKIENCYNTGKIEGTTKGEISGEIESPIENCYFLVGTINEAVGENEDNASVEAIAKPEAEMKTEGFINLINKSGTSWKRDTKNINNGYPILSWQ